MSCKSNLCPFLRDFSINSQMIEETTRLGRKRRKRNNKSKIIYHLRQNGSELCRVTRWECFGRVVPKVFSFPNMAAAYWKARGPFGRGCH